METEDLFSLTNEPIRNYKFLTFGIYYCENHSNCSIVWTSTVTQIWKGRKYLSLFRFWARFVRKRMGSFSSLAWALLLPLWNRRSKH